MAAVHALPVRYPARLLPAIVKFNATMGRFYRARTGRLPQERRLSTIGYKSLREPVEDAAGNHPQALQRRLLVLAQV